MIEAHRVFAKPADADRASGAAPGLVERDLRRGADESEVAVPRIHFMKAGADTLLRPDGKADRGE